MLKLVRLRRLGATLVRWFDADHGTGSRPPGPRPTRDNHRVDWIRSIPFILMHVACLAVFFVGWSWFAVGAAVFLYVIRMFAITGFYHRYFSHRTFNTSRFAQFLFAVLGASSTQRGPLWWAATHRHHHQHSDEEVDPHSPVQHGFLWSHVGWITDPANFPTDYSKVKDLAKYRELVLLNRFDTVVPILLAVSLLVLGFILERVAPGLGVTGGQLLVWGFFISTVALFHGTSCINSMAHVFGRRRYNTDDDSRNSFILAIITLGEGWHNNHHKYSGCVRQGFYWWEFDPTYYGLRLLAALGIIWDLRPVPAAAYAHDHHEEKVEEKVEELPAAVAVPNES